MPISILLTIISLSLTSALGQPDCGRDLFRLIKAEEGILDSAMSKNGEKFFKLDPNHSVFRVVPDGDPSKSYILKKYPSTDDLTNDLRGLAVLRNNPVFEVVAAAGGKTPKTMILKDIRGRSLSGILADTSTSAELRTKLVADYTRRVRELESFLRGRYEIESLRSAESAGRLPGFMARVIDPQTGESIKIWMKPDQIIIPETSTSERVRMIIIDAY
ncbi:MAG: hypothetical protein A2Z97_10590 [Bdellovibrionales bacterium GWB1_52_6]|nr:MAG: hypothetical protein A2Z97_10590 [Bdellovibrionales bacterium GWB1_52_6]OFZ02520.1 MAG: hypothetical protein A2X97_07615 [Bdellovibrionales bacterium GWA1_52_35]HCM41366.1 hypothetical protein [Bdellovibrionales bacterium]